MKSLNVLVFLLFAQTSFAKVIEVTVPDEGVSYDKVSVNFDGSVTVMNPKVYAAGEYLPFVNATYGYTHTSSIACALFGFSGKDTSLTERPAGEFETSAARLGYTAENGIFLSEVIFPLNGNTVVNSITCKKLQ